MKKLIVFALFVCAGYAAQAQNNAQSHTGHLPEMPKQAVHKTTVVPFTMKPQPAAPAKQTPAPAKQTPAPAKWRKN